MKKIGKWFQRILTEKYELRWILVGFVGWDIFTELLHGK